MFILHYKTETERIKKWFNDDCQKAKIKRDLL